MNSTRLPRPSSADAVFEGEKDLIAGGVALQVAEDAGQLDGHAHRMIALVYIDDGPGDPAREW